MHLLRTFAERRATLNNVWDIRASKPRAPRPRARDGDPKRHNNDITESLDSDEVDLLWTEILSYRQGEEEDATEMRAEMRREWDDD